MQIMDWMRTSNLLKRAVLHRHWISILLESTSSLWKQKERWRRVEKSYDKIRRDSKIGLATLVKVWHQGYYHRKNRAWVHNMHIYIKYVRSYVHIQLCVHIYITTEHPGYARMYNIVYYYCMHVCILCSEQMARWHTMESNAKLAGQNSIEKILYLTLETDWISVYNLQTAYFKL